MSKNRGFYLLNILVGISLVLFSLTLGFVWLRNYVESQEIKRAKTEIYEVFATYSAEAFNSKKNLSIELNYLRKDIRIYENTMVILDKVYLPKKLNYITIYDKGPTQVFRGRITNNGNITPSFSIYIFDYSDIARYRISFYGFDIIKYMRINIYRNRKDKSARYDDILNYHNHWENVKSDWEVE